MLLIHLQFYLENMLSVDVDLICKHKHMNQFFLNQIERDGISIIQ